MASPTSSPTPASADTGLDHELPTIQWVATGYTLALATLSGLAWSAGSLIFFRVLQGFGGGMLMPPA